MQDGIRPRLDPDIPIFRDLVWSEAGWLRGWLGIFYKRRGQLNIWQDRVDVHLSRDVCLKLCAQHKIDKFLSKPELVGTCENADKLDLSETGIGAENGPHRRIGEWGGGIHHFRCRGGCRGQYDWLQSFTG